MKHVALMLDVIKLKEAWGMLAEGRIFRERMLDRGDFLEELYKLYAGWIYSLIFRMVRDRGIAEDLVQETFWRVWNEAATFDKERGTGYGWLRVVARNIAIDYLRSGRSRRFEEFGTDASLIVDPRTVDLDDVEFLHAAIEQLNPKQKKVIELAYFEGLTQMEIAKLTGMPLGTVKTSIRAALSRLRNVVQMAEPFCFIEGRVILKDKTKIPPSVRDLKSRLK